MAIDYKARALKAAETKRQKKLKADAEKAAEDVVVKEEPKKPESHKDRFGRTWNFPLSQLCNVCGQPVENQGDCDHEKMSAKDAQVWWRTSQGYKPREPRAKGESKPATPCICGCGAMVKGRFQQGHDAKLHGMVSRAAKKGEKLNPNLRKLAGEYIQQRWPSEAKQVL